MPSTINNWLGKISDLSKQTPIQISSNAKVKVQIQAKNGH